MRICFVGDSFVNGAGDPACLGWVGRVCVAARQMGYDLTHYNLGVRRDTSTDIDRRWLREVSCRLTEEFDQRIVFSFGTNDTTLEAGLPRVDLSDSIKNAYKILSTASQQYPVLMIGPAPIADAAQNSRSANLSEQLQQLCHELNVPYLDVLTPLQQSPLWMQEVTAGDGAHPAAAGYAEYAQIVQNWSGWTNWFTQGSEQVKDVLLTKRPRISARALIIKNEAVLVTENVDGMGLWYVLPGGGQHYGEDLITCLKREVMEEVGLTIKVGNIRFVREFIARNHVIGSDVPKDFHSVEITFACDLEDDDVVIYDDRSSNPDPSQVGWLWLDLDLLKEKRFYPRKMIDLLKSKHSSPIYIGDSQ